MPRAGRIAVLAAVWAAIVAASVFAAEAPRLPRYTPGDNFTYSDGRTETVIEVSGEMIRWRNDLGFVFSQLPNPILPRMSWQRDGRRGETTLDALPDLLWPLQAGAAAEFVARRRVIEADGTRHDFVQHWRCRVAAPEAIALPAGRFDSWPLFCERRDDLGQLREKRRWWYSPMVGHVVATEEMRDGVFSRRELIAWRRLEPGPEPTDNPAAVLFQQALEKVASGQELSWTSPDGRHKVTVAPLRTFQREALYCRDFRLTTVLDGRPNGEQATACRSPDAVWRRVIVPSTD